MKKYLLLSLLLCCTSSYAESLDILLGGWSQHYVATISDLNESHSMIAVDVGKFNFGTYTNSYNNRSNFIGVEWDWYSNSYINIFCNIVATSGYKEGQMPPVVPVPTITLGKGLFKVDVSSIPTKVTMVSFRIKIF